MRFLEINEIRAWCGERGIALEDDARPAAPDPPLPHRERRAYAQGSRSGREGAVARACVGALGAWDECLLWVTLWEVWPSTEDWPRWYAARGAHGERRSLAIAPGHLFACGETDELAAFLTQAMENGWDAYLLPATGGRALHRRVVVSHDEWIAVESGTPVDLPESP